MNYDLTKINLDTLSADVAEALLKIKAVFLSPKAPFTWASGIKSPIYCDNRLTLSDPSARRVVEGGFAATIKAKYPDCEAVFGTSTAGIPHAAIVSEILDLPMGYVRSGAKEHGRHNQIEGADPVNKKVVVIEDLISTAGSSIEVVDALREAGANVLGIVSIFTYTLKKGIERLSAANVENTSLSDINALLPVAISQSYITEAEAGMVKKFISDPSEGSWAE